MLRKFCRFLVRRIRELLLIPRLEKKIEAINIKMDNLSSDILSIQYKDAGQNVRLVTDYPVAWDSDDHNYPRGSANDNTRYPRLIHKLNTIYSTNRSYLDFGCSGGGLVFDFIKAGWNAIGLEGSDYSQKTQRAFWSVIPKCLFTCDITRPFRLIDTERHDTVKFSVIGAWEVLEHIEERHLTGLIKNIKNHLADGGIFIASVATFEDYDTVSGAVWHKTINPKSWWLDMFARHGLIESDIEFHYKDFPRGSGNAQAADWDVSVDPGMGFHLVLTHRK